MIPYGHQSIDDDDITAVIAVLRSPFLTQGPAITEFEALVCELTGARHAVAVSSGTAALHAAVHAAGIGSGDVLWTSPLSFAASANAGRYVGAQVRFCDIDPTTLNIDLDQLPGYGVDCLVAVHYAGLPVDLSALAADRRPRVIVEDAAHAIGARTPWGPVGSCSHSDLCCFSFHPVKTATTAEGGVVTTNSDEMAERLRAFRHHGIRQVPGAPAWRYDIAEVGYNFRLTDIGAALGSSQLRKLERFLARRDEIAQRYRDELACDDRILLPPEAPAGYRHGRHLFPIRIPDRDRVFEMLRARGIGVQVHYVPTYALSAYARFEPDADVVARYPATEAAVASLLSLPMFVDLTDAEQGTVIRELSNLLIAM